MFNYHTHYTLVYKNQIANSFIKRLLFVFTVLFFSGISLYSQSNVSVCQNGVVRVGSFLTDATYMGTNTAPPGHLQKGYWSETAGLTFSDLNSPNAIISGFEGYAQGTTFTITWYHGLGQTYSITLEVTSDVAPDFTLLNEDMNTDNVLFCPPAPGKYEFTVTPQASASSVDYILYHQDGTVDEVINTGNPYDMNLNSAAVGYEDMDVIQALVSDGTCLDITTNTIQLALISSVVVQIQGNLSSCDATVFDGNHVLEVLPYDSNNFNYQWQFNGVDIAGATSATYTLNSSPGEGSYSVVVTNKTDPTCGTTTEPVVVSINSIPDITLDENPTGSGLFEICDGTTTETLTTTLTGGTMPANSTYEWYQNEMQVSGSSSTYSLDNDDLSSTYNAFGNYYVIFRDADNTECKSVSNIVTVETIALDDVTLVKANNALPFCMTGTPLLEVTVSGGIAPYTITIREGVNTYTRTLNSNGGTISLPDITSTTTYEITAVEEVATGCMWSGSKSITYNVYTSPSVQTTTGSDACVPTNSVSLSISTPDDGITYQLKRDNNGDGIYDVNVGAAITYNTGDPLPLTWSGYTTEGTYKVFASTSTCTDVPMDNEFEATASPIDRPLQAGGVAPYCSDASNPVTFSINAGEEGVDYNLYRDYGAVGETLVETLTGDAAASNLFFTPQYLAGTYTVVAVNGTCQVVMSNTITIVKAPDISGITLSATSYCETTSTTITISDTETGVTYYLYYDDGTGAVATGNSVAGSTGSARNIVTNTILSAGTYTVLAQITAGTCSNWINDQIDIISPPSDIAFVTNGYVCNSGNLILSLPGENAVIYTLYKDGVVDPTYPSRTGNGTNTIQFNGLAEGVYTVSASNGTCTIFLSNDLTVEATPSSQNITVLDNDYCSNESPVTITVDATEQDVEYQLINSSSSTVVSTISGLISGGAINFTGVTAGTYEIHATNNSCDIVIQTGIVITEHTVATVNDNIPTDVCSEDGITVIKATPAVIAGASTGLYEIIGGVGFDPGATADTNAGTLTFDPAATASETTFTIRYTYTDGNGCVVVEYGTLTVHDLNSGSLTISSAVPANPCQTDNTDYALQGMFNGSAVGGTFSSTSSGLKNIDVVNGSADFNPFDAGNGTHIVYFDYTDPSTNCTGQATISFTIGTPLSLVGVGVQYCSADNSDYVLAGSPAGGTFEVLDPSLNTIGSGIPDGDNWVNPENLFLSTGAGSYTLIYTYVDAGCVNTLTSSFDIVESIDASFTFPLVGGSEQTVFCDDDSPVTFIPNGVIGTASDYYTGSGVAGNTFVPSSGSVNYSPTANVITHTIDNNGCITTATREAYVTQLNVGISGLDPTYCSNSGTVSISANGTDASFGEATFSATINGNATAFLTDGGAGNNTATIDPSVGPGVYEVTMDFVKTGDGCSESITQNVTVYDEVPVSFWGVTEGQNICSSSADITLTGTRPDGGNGNFTLQGGAVGLTDAIADDGLAVLSPSSMTAGAYTIRYNYESADGCLSYFDVNINLIDTPTSTYSVTGGGAFCIDDPAPQGVTVGLSGSDTGVDYELLLNGNSIGGGITHTGDGTAFDFTPVQSSVGVYTVIADYSGCVATMNGSTTVEQYELVLQEVSKTNITCDGLSNGAVTLTATGGSGSYEYSENGGTTWQASPTFTGLAVGSNDFSVRDLSSAACEAIDVLTVNITEPTAIVVTEIDNIPVGCAGCSVVGGNCEGSSTISISGGTPDYVTYPGVGYGIVWSTGGTGETETNMPSGAHSVTVTDGNGCSQNLGVSIAIIAPALSLTESLASHVDNVCNSGAEGSYVVTAAGGSGSYEFSLTDPTTTTEVWLPGNIAANQYQVTGLSAGTYTIWVRDAEPIYNRCVAQLGTPVVITEPSALALVEESQVGITCNGSTDGSFIVQASNAISGSYEFSETDPAISATWVAGPAALGGDRYEVTNVGAGVHRVWMRDAVNTSCDYVYVDVTLSDIASFTYTLDEHTNVSCNSYTDGRLEVTAQGGSGNYVYKWEQPLGTLITNDKFIENLAAGDYFLTIEDNDPLSTCPDITQTFTITEPAVLTVDPASVTIVDADCAGEPNGSVSVDVMGGTEPYTISWSTGAIATETISGLAPGSYNINVVDDKGCIYNNAATPYVVGQLDPITLLVPAILTDNTCNGGSSGTIYVQVQGGSGDYEFRLEGPVIVDWSNSTSATMDDFTFTQLREGNYDVKVRDANNSNCEYLLGNYALTDPLALGLTTQSTSNVTCYNGADGSITILASGGSGVYDYNVDNGGYVVGGNPFTVSGLSSGSHSVWVRDRNAPDCDYQLHPIINITQVDNLDLTITSSNNITCNGGTDGSVTLSATGGSGDYDFSMDGGLNWDVATASTFNYDNLTAGVYDFQVRDHNATTCAVDAETFTLTEPLDFTTTCVATDVDCYGESTGELIFTTSGGSGSFSYSIDGGSTWQNSPIENLSAGTYTIDVKDNITGCIKLNQIVAADATITQPATSIVIGSEVITNVTCYAGTNGSIDLQGNVNGGTAAVDYNYTWYKKGTPDLIQAQGNGLDQISGLSEGTYYVVVEDDLGCTATSSDYPVTQPADWNVDYSKTDLTVYNAADGNINVHTHTGSNSGHTIQWYSVTAGVETILPTYDNIWDVNTLQAGTYRFKITDGLGCLYESDDIVISQPLQFAVTDPNTIKTDVSCYGSNDGILKVEIVSGTGDFTLSVSAILDNGNPYAGYSSTQSTTNFELTGLYAGQYTVVVTDNGTGETRNFVVEITQPNQLTIDLVSSENITCNGGNDGEIEIEISGGAIDETNSTITWTRNPVGWSVSGIVDNGTIDNRIQSALYAGTYTVSVQSENGCVATPLTVTLTEKDAISASEIVTHVTSNGGTNGRIYVDNIVSVDAVSSVEWYKKDATGTYVATGVNGVDNPNLTAGTYQYVITDNQGCTFTSTDILVSEPGQPLAVVVSDTDINCFGEADGIISVNISTGVAPFSVTLTGTQDNGSPFTAQTSTTSYSEFDNLQAGTYQVQVADGAGQSYTQNAIVISENPETVLNLSTTDMTCNGDIGLIELNLSGHEDGSESWQILDPNSGEVYNGALSVNSSQSVVQEGEYSIVVTNMDGCILTDKITVNEPDPFVIDWDATDATVYGANDGIIDVHTVTGSNGTPYTISWTDDATVTDFMRNDLLASTYEFTIEDASGCDTTISAIVIGQPNPLTVVVTSQDAVCYGDTNGEIQVEIQSHNGGYYYQITGNQDDGGTYDSGIITPVSVNSVVDNLEAGTYTIDVYDGKGTNYHEENIRIDQETDVSLSGAVSNISCFGDGNGSVSVALVGRAALATDNIVWSGSNGTYLSGDLLNNNVLSPVTEAETFNVVVSSEQGCTYSGTYTVTEPNEILISIDNIKDATCSGGADGEIDISVSGRTGGGYTYAWEKKDASDVYQSYAGTSASLTGLSAGEYQVTVTSITDNCEATYSDIEVLDGSELIINESLTHITSCAGDNSGIISISIEDGISPYVVNVTGQGTKSGDGSSAFVFDNLAAGNYVIEVSDSRGLSCATVTKNVTITEPAIAFEVSNLSYDIDCDANNVTSGIFTFDVTGGIESGGNYRYQILLPEASIAKPVSVVSGTTHTELINNLTAGTYNLTVLDLNSSDPAACAFNYQFTLEHIEITNNPVVNTTCEGVQNGAINGITIEGASLNYIYNWTTTDGGVGLDNTTLNQSGLTVGTYVLEITDPDRGGCSVTKEFNVGVDNTIVITPTIKDVSCNGGSDGVITLDVTGVSPTTTYTWSGPGIVDSNQEDQDNLTSGNYILEISTVIDGQTCIANKSYTVDEPDVITYTARYEYTDCEPFVRTLIVENLTGGSGTYSYLWNGPSFTPSVPADPTNVQIYRGGDYSITVKDINQCELTKTLSVPDEITIDPVITDVTCNGGYNGAVLLNVSGGSGLYSFSWTGPSGYTSTDRTIDNLYAGEYTVVITDQFENDGTSNCSRTFTLEVEEPDLIEINSIVDNTSCYGESDGKIELEVSGGNAPYTYNWTPVTGTNQATNKDQYNLPADTYTVTVTDASGKGGCIATKDIEVQQDALIELSTVVVDTQCDGAGGAIDLTVTGGSGSGFTYNWSSSDGSGLEQGSQDQSGLYGGTYVVVVTDLGDGRSCSVTTSETLTHEIEIVDDNVTPVSCSGNADGSISYNVIGGDGNYIYSWNVISGDATRIVAGAQNQAGLSEGEYEVTITDGRTSGGMNCAITKSFVLTASTGLSVNVAVEDSKMCFGEPGGKLTASVTGGSGDYSYYWNGVAGTEVLDELIQGIYGLRVVDNVLGCSFMQSYEINGPSAPLTIDNIVVTNVLCYSENTGAIQVSVSGGTLPTSGDYIYTWTSGSGAATGSSPGNLYAGTYNLTVTDANGCSVESGDIVVSQPAAHIKVDNPQITDVSVPSGSDGQILVDVYDGVAPRSVEWFDSSNSSLGTLNPVTGLTSGTYSVIATDNNGCTASLTGIKVVEPGEALGFEKTVHQVSPCNSENNGEIHINRVYGGFPIDGDNYRIQITGPGTNVDTEATSYDLTGLAPGTYRVIVTDDVPVSYQEDIVISEYSALLLTTTKLSDVSCYGTATGEIEVLVNGGKSDSNNYYLVEITSEEGYYAYKDDVLANTAFTFDNLPSGNYTITAIDHADDFDTKDPDRGYCEISEFTLISEPAASVAISSVGGDNEICKGESIDLAISTDNWDFATQGNLRVSVYDNFSTQEYIIDETPYVISTSPTSSRTYKVTSVANPSDASCMQGETSGSQVQVSVNDLPAANITGPSEVCEDGTVTLSVTFTGTGPFTFTWRDELNGTSDTETVDTYSYSFTDTPVGDARYTVMSVSDANSCSAAGNGLVEVIVNGKPEVSLTGATDICIGESADLTISLQEGTGPFTFTYTANGVEGTFVVNNTVVSDYTWTVTPDETTIYQITNVVDAKGCVMDINSSLLANVIVNPLPDDVETILSTTDNGSVCQEASNVDYYVDEVQNATSYIWSVDPGMTIVTGNGTSSVLVDFDRTFAGGYIKVYTENDCGTGRVVERWVNASVLPDEITTAPSGPTDICEAASGLVYTIPVSDNASYYEWQIPAGLIVVGDATGTSVVVDVNPNVTSTTGEISVRPVNNCSSDEPWSPGLTVTITPLPEAYAGADERICRTTYTLGAGVLNANESGQWTIITGSGQFVDVANDPFDSACDIYNLSQGENTFVWTLTNNITGCNTSDTVRIFNDQVSVYAGAENYTVCDGIAQLNGTPLDAVIEADEAYWSTTGNAYIIDNNDENTTVQGMDDGTNVFTWTIRKGACYSTASVEIENNEPSEALIYNASGVLIEELDLPCGDNFTTLSGNIPSSSETGYWRIESGNVTIDDVNSPTINISNITSGDHTLSWNIINGSCSSKTTVIIRNNYYTVDAGIDNRTCDGSINLEGSELEPGTTGLWTIIEGGGSFEDSNSPSTLVSGLSQVNNGRNVFRWTVRRNGCESYDDVVVLNNEPSAAELRGNITTDNICAFEYDLNAIAPVYGTGLWTVVSGRGSFDDPTNPTATVSDVAIGENVYRWTVYNEECTSAIDFTLSNLHVEAYAGADTAVCGKVAQLNATPAPAGSTGYWSVVSGAGSVVFNPSADNPSASATSLGYGVNSLVWTVTQNGCTSSDTVNVSNNMPYEVSASTDIYTDGSSVTLRAETPTVGTGLWTLMEGRGTIANPNLATTEVTDLLPNYNYFRWTVTNMGCTDYIDVTVQSGVLSEADAGNNQLDLCQNYTTLSANEPEGTYGEWTIVSGSADFASYNDPETQITNIRAGRNVFMWTLRFAGGSVESKSDTVVIVNNSPTEAYAGYDITVCGDNTALNAKEPVIGEAVWSILSGGAVFEDDTDPKTVVSGLGKGENVLKYQVQNNGCFSYDTVSVFNYEPSDAYAGEDQTVCKDSASLNPEIPTYGEGTWRVIEGSGNGKDAKGNVTEGIKGNYVYDLAPGINKLVWEVKVDEAMSACVKRDTLTIINNEPSDAYAGNDRVVCADSVVLSGSVSVYGTGSWTLIAGSGTIADVNDRNTKVTDLALGSNRFRWTVDNNGCTSYDDVVISNNLIESVAGYDQVNCADTAMLEANNPSPGEGTWGVLGGSGSANFEDNENPYTKVYNLDKGDNILTWTINYEGCSSVSQVVITNNQPSDADAGDNKSSCENSIVLGASTPEIGDGSWTIRSGGGQFTNPTDPSTRVDSMKFGSNVYRWTVEHEGCVSYDDVEIAYNKIEAVVGENQDICADNTYLEANNASPGTGTWTVVGGSSSAKFTDVNDPTTQVYDLAKGDNVLRWTINNEGCSTYAEVTVVNNVPSTAYAGNTQELCISETTLDATAVSVGTGTWEVLTGSATIAEINNPKSSVTGLSKGENVLRWKVISDNGLCSLEDEVVIINNEPSEPYAGADEEYCYNSVILKAAEPDYGTGMWSIISGGGNFNDASLPNATISNLNPGENVLRWTVTKGQCSLYSDIVITNSTPTTASAGPDIEDCKDYAYLDANTPIEGTGYWSLISGNASFTDVTDPKTMVTGLTFGENVLMWNIQNGNCVSSDQVSVFNQIPDQAEAGVDRSTCDDYLTLNANNPDSGEGTWVVISGQGEFDDVNNPTTIVRNLGLGENQFKWIVSYGECTTEDVVEVTCNKADPFAGEDDITYESSYEMKASNPGDLGASWSVVAGTGNFEDDTFFNTIVNDLSGGVNTFRWMMNVNGCVTYDDVSITYKVVPDANFITDTTSGCYPLTIEFTNYSEGGSVFEWDFGDGNSSTQRNPVYTYETPGVYTVTLIVTGPDGVDGNYSTDITVYDHPVADFSYSPDIVYIPGDVLRCYSLATDAVYYSWDFGDGESSDLVNPSHEYTEEGIYDITLSVVSEYGCTDEIVKEDAITAVLQGFIEFPNSFMPRPDGGISNPIGGGETNVVFRPVYKDVADYKLQIYNRWGQLIYESTDIDEGWNGFFNGTLSPQAVYVWKASGTFVSGKTFNKAGSVLLVR